jgi:hypothetical protein
VHKHFYGNWRAKFPKNSVEEKIWSPRRCSSCDLVQAGLRGSFLSMSRRLTLFVLAIAIISSAAKFAITQPKEQPLSRELKALVINAPPPQYLYEACAKPTLTCLGRLHQAKIVFMG